MCFGAATFKRLHTAVHTSGGETETEPNRDSISRDEIWNFLYLIHKRNRTVK